MFRQLWIMVGTGLYLETVAKEMKIEISLDTTTYLCTGMIALSLTGS